MHKDLDNLRHSCAHLLAAAVMQLYPQAKRAIGPAIEHGFYFDFDFGNTKVSDNDLPKIEKKMHEIVKSWKSFERCELSVKDAKRQYPGNSYKHELIDEFSKQGRSWLTFYKSGDYWDLCRGGHVEHPSKELKHFKLLSVAGAYWRGNEKNKMLTRIYGTAFPNKAELDTYLRQLEEAQRRDHRKLAKELDLVVFSPIVGSGLPMYTPKGTVLRNAVYDYSKQLNEQIGYHQVTTPNINRDELFKISGHYDKFKDDMLRVTSNYSDEEFFLKPMNCPQHCALYMSQPRSYRDLPVRFADFSVLYRDERPGEIHGLLRSRAFTQDDGHAFCRNDQIGQEFENVLGVIKQALHTYGFDFWVRLSLRDPEQMEKYLGNHAIWDQAEQTLARLVKRTGVTYRTGIGEAAMYGPKLDFMVADSLGREWQLSTIQLDMNMPQRFGLTYIDDQGNKQTPVMIHRAIIGSERFIAILIEHYAGKFPLWLAPTQVVLIPIASRHTADAAQYQQALQQARLAKQTGIRIEVDGRAETMQAKIRHHTLQKVPYIGIIGDKEVQNHTLAIRTRDGTDRGEVARDLFIQKLHERIEKKTNEI